MFRERSEEFDLVFSRILKSKLNTLEHELLQAHSEVFQSLVESALTLAVPDEMHESMVHETLNLAEQPDSPLSANGNSATEEHVNQHGPLEPRSSCGKIRGFSQFQDEQELLDETDQQNEHHRNSVQSLAESEPPPLQVVPPLVLRPNWQSTEASETKSTRNSSRLAVKINEVILEQSTQKDRRHASSANLDERYAWQCIIFPTSRSWVSWEMLGFIFLIHDIIFVPMQVFELPQTFGYEFLKWLIMIYWTVTLFLTFIVSFQDKSDVHFITDHMQIIRHYLHGYFILDFAVISCDWISVVIDFIVDNSSDSLASARIARLARLSRIFRTARILRVMRIGEMMHHMRSLIDSEWTGICFLLTCNVVAILCLAHMTACIWFGIGNANDRISWIIEMKLADAPVGDQYLQSLGWSLSTLLGTSVTRAFPQTTKEYTCALVILVVGTIVISLVFSSTTASMTRLHELQSAERQATFNLRTYLKQNHISSNLKARVVRYVDIAKSVHSGRLTSEQVTLLHLLSGPLRLELQLELHSPHLILHRFFQIYHRTNVAAMSEICWSAVGFVYLCRHDALFQSFAQAKQMYFLVSGVMVYRRAKGAKNTRTIVKIDKKHYFCEAAIWTNWVHRGGMKAMIESQILALEVDVFCHITESHHNVFLKACEYARLYVTRTNDQLLDDEYIWDIESELMYPEKYGDHLAMQNMYARKRMVQYRHEAPAYVKMLREAEELAAEFMDIQSESDSEDERILNWTLKNLPTSGQADSRKASPRGCSSDEVPHEELSI